MATPIRSHFGSSRDPSPRLGFPLHVLSRHPHQDSFRVRFWFCCVHRVAPVACRLVIKCGKAGCTGSCPLSVVECGYKAGKKPATCRTCGRTFPGPSVTLSDFLPARGDGKKRNSSQHASLAMSPRSSWVSQGDSLREQSVASGEDTVMEGCTDPDHRTTLN